MTEDKVKARIVELVPEIAIQGGICIAEPPHKGTCEYETFYREITLADVLRAIEKTDPSNKYHVRTDGTIGTISPVSPMTHVYAHWNLLKHYDNQTPEVCAFISKLIGVTD